MATQLLLDTTVLVDYLRDKNIAVKYLEGIGAEDHLLISSVTVAELYAGVRDGKELARLESLLSAFDIVPVDRAIAEKGGLYRRDYGPSHGTGLADALIAASAVARLATLVTLNKRHFVMLDKVTVPY
ncbi:MAG: type II toxin-antitoxin system VapC family toxin [Candidatus Neomarinimicrobiota bacterium]